MCFGGLPELLGPLLADDARGCRRSRRRRPRRTWRTPWSARRRRPSSDTIRQPVTAPLLGDQSGDAGAEPDLEPRARRVGWIAAHTWSIERLAAAPGEMEARNRVAVAVHAALGPVDDREEADAVTLQPVADLVPGAGDVLLGPPPRPFVGLVEPGDPLPVAERSSTLSLIPERRCSGVSTMNMPPNASRANPPSSSGWHRSSSSTVCPVPSSSSVATSPAIPAPTTTTSTRSLFGTACKLHGARARAGTCQGIATG